MRSDRVVVPAPAFDHDLGFSERVEDFAIEQFVAQARIEAFDIAVLSRATWCDVGRFCANDSDPFLYGLGHELGTIV